MEPEGSLPCSQEPAAGPCPEPLESATSHPIYPSSILIFPFHLRLVLSSGLFPKVFLNKMLHAFVIHPMRATCLVHLILPELITWIFDEE